MQIFHGTFTPRKRDKNLQTLFKFPSLKVGQKPADPVQKKGRKPADPVRKRDRNLQTLFKTALLALVPCGFAILLLGIPSRNS